MHIFLTSLPYGIYREALTPYSGFNPANGFEEKIKSLWKPDSNVLFVASEPDNYEMVDAITSELKFRLRGSGLTNTGITACDHRNPIDSIADITRYDAVFLSGGHVPTTNDFYHEIGLKEKLKPYDGILVGISSGSMNSAENVYAQPEFEGESAAEFVRFRKGLGLVNASVIPHYNATRDDVVDGRRLFEDITFKDSAGRRFYVIYDGTYITRDIDKKTGTKTDAVLHGKAELLADGIMSHICDDGSTYVIDEG